jgi:hypothetical protein
MKAVLILLAAREIQLNESRMCEGEKQHRFPRSNVLTLKTAQR